MNWRAGGRLARPEPSITSEIVLGLEPSVRPHVIAARIVDEARRRCRAAPDAADVDPWLLAAEVDRIAGLDIFQ